MDNKTESFSELIRRCCSSGQVNILGVAGQAGAGKTNHVSPLIAAEANKFDFPVEILRLDAFFKLSSSDRKNWIEEGLRISPQEAAVRQNMLNWWDFKAAEAAIEKLRQKEPLHLTNVYNRADGGNLTGEVRIDPPEKGMLLIFEGVAICHLDGIDHLMYVYASPEVRLERLRQRDKHRQGQEVLDRFALTESFERSYFSEHWGKINSFVDNSVDSPKVLGPMSYNFAFGIS